MIEITVSCRPIVYAENSHSAIVIVFLTIISWSLIEPQMLHDSHWPLFLKSMLAKLQHDIQKENQYHLDFLWTELRFSNSYVRIKEIQGLD